MDDTRGALVPLAKGVRLKTEEARCSWSVSREEGG
jgi:hypothetical protein